MRYWEEGACWSCGMGYSHETGQGGVDGLWDPQEITQGKEKAAAGVQLQPSGQDWGIECERTQKGL